MLFEVSKFIEYMIINYTYALFNRLIAMTPITARMRLRTTSATASNVYRFP